MTPTVLTITPEETGLCRTAVDLARQMNVVPLDDQPAARDLHGMLSNDTVTITRLTGAQLRVLVFCLSVLYGMTGLDVAEITDETGQDIRAAVRGKLCNVMHRLTPGMPDPAFQGMLSLADEQAREWPGWQDDTDAPVTLSPTPGRAAKVTA